MAKKSKSKPSFSVPASSAPAGRKPAGGWVYRSPEGTPLAPAAAARSKRPPPEVPPAGARTSASSFALACLVFPLSLAATLIRRPFR